MVKTRHTANPMRPNLASWIVWWVIDFTMVVSLIAAGSYNAVPMFAAFCLGSSIVLLLSVKHGNVHMVRFDYICVAIALLGLVASKVLENPIISISASIFSALAGTVPTVRKAWMSPASEDLMTWTLFAIGGLLNCFAIEQFSFVTVIPPLGVLTAQMSVILAIKLPRSTPADYHFS